MNPRGTVLLILLLAVAASVLWYAGRDDDRRNATAVVPEVDGSRTADARTGTPSLPVPVHEQAAETREPALGTTVTETAAEGYWPALSRELRESKLHSTESLREEDGSLRLEGVAAPESSLRIRARAPHYSSSAWMEVPVGGANRQLITLEQSGSITGRLLLDAGVPKDHIELVARSGKSKHDTYSGIGGRFEIRNLDAGTANLIIRNRHTRWVLLELEGIQVPGGTASVDPRLAEIDLRGRLVQMKLTLSGSDGKPIAKEHVWVSGPNGQGGGTQKTDRRGRLFVWMPSDASECGLKVSGFEPVRVPISASEQSVTLLPR